MELNIRIGGLKFGSGVTRLCDLVCTYSAKSTYICIINEFKRYSPHVFYKAKAQTYRHIAFPFLSCAQPPASPSPL